MPSTRQTRQSIYRRLAAHYGSPSATHPCGRPLDVLIETILSQHTSDRNSHRAFLALRRAFPVWATVLTAPRSAVERAIRSGGLARQKSARIQEVLRIIQQREGRLSLARLKRLSTAEAFAYLTGLPGVGSKTACCVLLFALNRAVMPVDTHIHRIAKRLEWIPDRGTPEHARAALERGFPDGQLYHLHVLLIAHGRETCTARRPLCTSCPIRTPCPSATGPGKESAVKQ